MATSELSVIYDRLNDLTSYFYIQKGKEEHLLIQREQSQQKLDSITKEADLLERVRLLLQKAGEYAREQSKVQIERLVTYCLQYIFGNDIKFEIEINEKSGRIEADFFVETDYEGYKIRSQPQDTRGGGVIDIISLAIRLSMLQSYYPEIYGPIVLDEPAKHVSEEYIVNVSNFLSEISELLGRQVIMITHNLHLAEISKTSYSVSLDKGISVVAPIRP
ncbi:MAG: ATPase [Mahellales bacterium]